MRRKCVCLGLAALLLGLLALLTSWECHGWYLVLRNADTGQYYGRYAMDEGDWFSVSFVHSVNKSPVTDCYQIRDQMCIRDRPWRDWAFLPSSVPMQESDII